MKRGLVLCVALVPACRDSGSQTSGGDVVLTTKPAAALAQEIAANPTLRAADSAITGGHAWRATVGLAPLLRDATHRTPAAVLLAARAAAAWDGWAEVTRLLRGQTWGDPAYGGEGRELSARAALELNADSAVQLASAAVNDAPSEAGRARRRVFLA